MLPLRVGNLDFSTQTITLRGETTKSGKTHRISDCYAGLKAVLEWLCLDASGKEEAADAPVFSHALGEAVSICRKAWIATVLRAHGIKPSWTNSVGVENATPR